MSKNNKNKKRSINTEAYRVAPGTYFNLRNFDAADTGDYPSGDSGRKAARAELRGLIRRMTRLQNLLYADGSRALLVVFQALDAGGKDGTIRRVMSGVNPQGVLVSSFKKPTEEELAHDFLWRIHKAAPRKGMIGIFNRSHYEDVLVARVHKLVPEPVWQARFEQINAFESLLDSSGTKVLKIHLSISRDEQKERLEARLKNPNKNWKFNLADLKERQRWDDYIEAYEDVLQLCSSPDVPWYVIPANKKWYRDVVVAKVIVGALEAMDLSYPSVDLDLSQISIPD